MPSRGRCCPPPHYPSERIGIYTRANLRHPAPVQASPRGQPGAPPSMEPRMSRTPPPCPPAIDPAEILARALAGEAPSDAAALWLVEREGVRR